MKATITEHKGTLTYTVRIFNSEGVEVFKDWCGSYSMAERVARSYEAPITNMA